MRAVGRNTRFLATAAIVAGVGLAGSRGAIASPPQLVNLPYNIAIGSYSPSAGGHDAHSYWIWYHSKNAGTPDYAAVIAVPDGLPANFAFALPHRAKPHIDPADHSKIIIIGPSLTSQDRSWVRGGLASETKSAFFQLAASKTFVRDVDTRPLTAKGMTVRVAASTNGSLATGLAYNIRWNPHLSAGHGQPLPLSGWLDCYQYDANRAILAVEQPGATHITIAEDGHTVVSNGPMARDPLQPATRVYALFMPQSVKTVTINGSSFSLQDCENRD